MQGLQTLTMANAAGAQSGATILQYAQTSDGQQILVPSNQVVVQGGEMTRHHVPLKRCAILFKNETVRFGTGSVSSFFFFFFFFNRSQHWLFLHQLPLVTSRPTRSAQPPPAPSLPGSSWPLHLHWAQVEAPRKSRAKGKSDLWKTGMWLIMLTNGCLVPVVAVMWY